jgi:outer membrane autotransporter protein
VFGGSGGGIGGGAIGYASETNVSPAAAEAYAAVTPRDRRAVPFTARWNVWATSYGGYNKVDGSASTGSADTTSRVFGLVAGAEYRFSPDTKAGFVMGGSTSNFDLSNGFGNGSADAFNLAVYGKHQMGAAYVAGALGYSLQSAKTKRVVASTNVLEADFTANVITARLEGGYRFAMTPINIAPYAALQSTTYFLPSYSERATAGLPAFALSYDSDAITATRTELGARFDKVIAAGEGIWKLKSKLAWAHDWNTDVHATAAFQSLPGATFTVNGAEPSADSALVSLGAEYAWGHGWSLAANFDGEFSSTTSSYAGKGTLRYEW